MEAELARRLGLGEEVIMATVIKLDGEPPSHAGAKLLMSAASPVAGTLGCSEFDSAALADAAGVSRSGSPQLRTYSHDLGSIEVYLEPYAATPTLVVFAATPVARSLVRWAPEVGFRPILVETRSERLAGAEVAGAVTSLTALRDVLAGEVYAVHTDHDAEDIVQALEALLTANPRFIGLVGSRRHTGHHLEALRAKGVPEELIARIQSPVGLDVGARTPPEIALSILAGLVAVRHGAAGGWKQGSTIG